MKKIFVKTKNVKNFIALTQSLENKKINVPKIGLVYGEPGLGKTQTVIWWAAKNNAIYIRANNQMTNRWFLEELVSELGESPYNRTSALLKQCVSKLKSCPQTIVIDEVDYLIGGYSKCIETIRDIHDKTDVPIILVGMGLADRKLTRYKHFYDRISEKLMFEPFRFEDLKMIVQELSEVKLTDSAIEFAFLNINRFRQIVKIIGKIEEFAYTNGINTVDEKTIRGMINE